ncbi:LPS-assembly protein [Methylomarinovum tepidoasis]|uniref:LPS-assembly protein LptD n=1 Tax=Methylomarinovum tepidoasis TaxID=2840183 RepID=A0AAU9CQT5_9GAMM|nr:LPS-assembly protein [Methylomarinovum sp. IN45]
MPRQRKGKPVFSFTSLALGLLASAVAAEESAAEWNCRSVNGEWVCNGQTQASSPPDPAKPPVPADTTAGAGAPPASPRKLPPLQVGKVGGVPPAPKIEPQQIPEGWTCEADDRGGWRCKLVGVEPGGKPHLAKIQQEPSLPWLHPTFSAYDDHVFKTLVRLLPEDPWQRYCATGRAALGDRPPIRPEGQPLDLEADYSRSLTEDLVYFSGNVKVRRGGQHLWTDALLYDGETGIVNAWGNVIYEENGYIFASDNAWLDLERGRARMNHTHFILGPVPARGTTARSRFESETLSRHHQVAYTTCPIGNDDWVVHARDLKINRETGKASGHHVWLEFMRVPFLYSPYFSYTIDDRRISGFLTPRIGISNARGFDAALPYYFNLAPNYDLTLIPRVMSKRGFLGGLEFRYLLRHSRGRLAGEILPYDSVRKKIRGEVAFYNQTRFTPHWTALADLRYVSDKHYINELGDNLSIASSRQLHSQIKTEYRQGDWYFMTRADNWQTVDPNLSSRDKPYRRLPQMVFNYDHAFAPWLRSGWQSEFVFFQHDDRSNGHRLHLRPRVQLPWRHAAAFAIPSLAFDYTRYWLPGKGRSLSRALPVASLNTGLFLEKNWGRNLIQTLEPRLFYLYIPFDDQDDIPVFDTSRYDFNFSQLFRENRFSGADRLGDANQISYALTSRFLTADEGAERLRLSAGQIYYFRDRRVTLPGEAVETRNTSNIIGELDLFPNRLFSLRSGIQWDPYDNQMDRGEAMLQYKDSDDYIANLSYRFRRDRLKIVDGSFRWLLFQGLHAVGRWQYSLRDAITLESFLGVEAESCCWRVRVIGRRFVRDVNRTTETAVFAQLELKGLISLGKHVDRFLQRNIRGYGFED